MSRLYLLVYSDGFSTRDQVKEWADRSSHVETWRYDLPYSFYLISTASADELSRDMESVLGSEGRYLLTELGEDCGGRLPADTWRFLYRTRRAAGSTQPAGVGS